MKRILVGLVLVVGVLCAEMAIKAPYVSLTGELPAGAVLSAEITAGGNVFVVNGSTYTSFTYNYTIPSNTQDAGYSFNIPVSSQNFVLIMHGELK